MCSYLFIVYLIATLFSYLFVPFRTFASPTQLQDRTHERSVDKTGHYRVLTDVCVIVAVYIVGRSL